MMLFGVGRGIPVKEIKSAPDTVTRFLQGNPRKITGSANGA
jgi:hypothetical protein